MSRRIITALWGVWMSLMVLSPLLADCPENVEWKDRHRYASTLYTKNSEWEGTLARTEYVLENGVLKYRGGLRVFLVHVTSRVVGQEYHFVIKGGTATRPEKKVLFEERGHFDVINGDGELAISNMMGRTRIGGGAAYKGSGMIRKLQDSYFQLIHGERGVARGFTKRRFGLALAHDDKKTPIVVISDEYSHHKNKTEARVEIAEMRLQRTSCW